MSGNVIKLKCLTATWAFLMLQGVSFTFFNGRGLSASEIYSLFAAMAFTTAVLEVPTGVLSDLFARKRTLVLAAIFKGIGGTIIALEGSGFAALLVAYACIGAANSLYSGTDLSLLYESLPNSSSEAKLRHLSSMHVIAIVSVTAATLLGSAFAPISLNLAAALNCMVIWSSFFIALSLREPARKAPDTDRFARFRSSLGTVLKELLGRRRGALTSALYGMLFAFAPAVSVVAFQKRWLDFGRSAAFGGYATACAGLAGALFFAFWLSKRLKTMNGPVAFAFTPFVLAGFLLGSSSILSLTILGAVCIEIVRGGVTVSFVKEFNEHFQDDLRATANSILNFLVRSFIWLFSSVWGWSLENNGSQASFLGLSLLYLIPSLLLGWGAMQRFAPVFPLTSKPTAKGVKHALARYLRNAKTG